MIIRFEHKKISFGKRGIFVYRNHVLAGRVSYVRGKGVNIQGDLGEKEFSLSIPTLFGATIKEGLVTKMEAGTFLLDGKPGRIYDCGKKGSNFLNGIGYWSFCINGNTYDVYEVGFGRKGLYYCVWEKETLIAIISQDIYPKYEADGYDIYLEDASYFELLVLINAYCNVVGSYNRSTCATTRTLTTWQKELKNKYDPDFIARVKSMRE